MSSRLFMIAIMLIFLWAVGYYIFKAGSVVHILLVLAALSILISLIKGDKVIR